MRKKEREILYLILGDYRDMLIEITEEYEELKVENEILKKNYEEISILKEKYELQTVNLRAEIVRINTEKLSEE